MWTNLYHFLFDRGFITVTHAPPRRPITIPICLNFKEISRVK